MPAVRSILTIGSEGVLVDAESHFSNGLPAIIIVGLGSKAIDEAKERIRSAFANNHLPLPRKRITINLAPADIPKESTSLDLAIALSILQTSGQISQPLGSDAIVIGELGLEGDIRPVRGIIGKLLAAKDKGIREFYLPADNTSQALLVPGVIIIPVKNLQELYKGLNGQLALAKKSGGVSPLPINAELEPELQLSDIAGQSQAKRALQIVAAGGHNILLSGPPGTGKTMLAKALPAILPPLTRQEMLDVTNVYSLVSGNYEQLITKRPFRGPHHSASHVAITGGGLRLRPGEISLAHRGVLFLDELPEFGRATIEALRQPLEDKTVTINRARESATYPANFILVATANPCPCGYFGSTHACQCSANAILHYKQKLSGPIMDRIDLHVTVEEIEHRKLLHTSTEEKDKAAQTSVLIARELQAKRYGSATKLNADMSNRDIKNHAFLRPAAEALLNQAAERLAISARSYMRVIKVARTIADLTNVRHIEPEHITEAMQYRPPRIDVIS